MRHFFVLLFDFPFRFFFYLFLTGWKILDTNQIPIVLKSAKCGYLYRDVPNKFVELERNNKKKHNLSTFNVTILNIYCNVVNEYS
jgi:hypothetical protein